jgi:hypothetical protein
VTPVSPHFSFSKPVSESPIRENAFENGYREPRSREIASLARKSWSFSITIVCEKPRGEPSLEETAVPIGFLSDAERERLDSFPA